MATNIVLPYPVWVATCFVSALNQYLLMEVPGLTLNLINPRRFTVVDKGLNLLKTHRRVRVKLWSPSDYADIELLVGDTDSEEVKINKVTIKWSQSFQTSECEGVDFSFKKSIGGKLVRSFDGLFRGVIDKNFLGDPCARFCDDLKEEIQRCGDLAPVIQREFMYAPLARYVRMSEGHQFEGTPRR